VTLGPAQEAFLWAVRIGAVFGVGFLLLTPVAGVGAAGWIVARQPTVRRRVVAIALIALLVLAAVTAFVAFRPSDQPAPEFPGAEPSVAPES
jgi:hypothetical protein